MPHKNPEDRKKCRDKYYKEHKKEIREQQKEYYQSNSEKIKATAKAWALENLGSAALRFSKLKSKTKTEGTEMSLSLEEYTEIVKDGICLYCQSDLPKWGYGLDRLDNRLGYVKENVVPCCKDCNDRKGALEGAGLIYPRTVEILLEILDGQSSK